MVGVTEVATFSELLVYYAINIKVFPFLSYLVGGLVHKEYINQTTTVSEKSSDVI